MYISLKQIINQFSQITFHLYLNFSFIVKYIYGVIPEWCMNKEDWRKYEENTPEMLTLPKH